MKKIYLFGIFYAMVSVLSAATLTFENEQLGAAQQLTGVNSYWNGSPQNTTLTAVPNGNYKEAGDSTPFVVDIASFSNSVSYDTTYKWWSWSGFGVSNAEGTFTQGGQTTEMFAYPASNDGNYLVGYWSGWTENATMISFGQTVTLESVDLANAAWTALGATVGDDFMNGLIDGDSLTLVITKEASWETATDRIEVDLAYKNVSEALYVLDDWTTVDLSGLGETDALYFNLQVGAVDYGGIMGAYGTNIATYFALDNLVYQTLSPVVSGVPEPSAWILLGLGVAVLLGRRRERKTSPIV
ncbi:MAG: DUF4465 domain-containing protein [Planctomycetia bacterium]|nr:DUF4465 domain-containing protein [Planctomycetia bacterium]